MIEDAILAQCHQWLHNNYPELRGCFFHVPNERKCSKIEGARNKAKGVVAGVPDYFFFFGGQVFIIEFKSLAGTTKPAQKEVQSSLLKQGFQTHTIRTFEEFKTFILNVFL